MKTREFWGATDLSGAPCSPIFRRMWVENDCGASPSIELGEWCNKIIHGAAPLLGALKKIPPASTGGARIITNMSLKNDPIAIAGTDQPGGLKSYAVPWDGEVILVCRKCQKKLRNAEKKNKLGKLSKELKKRSRREGSGPKLHVIEVSCLKVCPKGGVTVCPQKQLARNEFSILRSTDDIDALIAS